MIPFHKPNISDKEWIPAIMAGIESYGCESSLGYILMWSHAFDFGVACVDGMLLIRLTVGGKRMYSFPLGNGFYTKALEVIAEEEGGKPRFFGITEERKNLLETFFGAGLEVKEARGTFDYIYRTDDLADLPGKAYHSKKNHISWFEKNYDWSFEAIDTETLPACQAYLLEWERENWNNDPIGLEREHKGLDFLLKHYSELPIEGGLLKANGRVVAFTLGDALNPSVFCTHAEKAFGSVRGAYPMINREFARYLRKKGYHWINREEDDGIEGLRRAKLSYHPAILLEKYEVVVL